MISKITVQFSPEQTHVTRTITLDGVRVKLATYTNRADASWYLDVLDADDVPLVVGLALAAGLDLLWPYRHLAGLPPGALFVAAGGGDPGLDSFADRGASLYYEAASS